MTNYQFPKDFYWGSASSGPQSEGRYENDGKGDNIWDLWYKEQPELYFNTIGPEKTSQAYTHIKEDVALLKATGHNSFRTSIQWSRLIPEGRGAINPAAVKFYNELIDELLANDIEPFINLYHFDMPVVLQKEGGWENRKTIDAYVAYATACFELFGDRVKKWFTHNEPIVPVEGGYLYGFHYPHEVSFKAAVQVGYHEMLASAKAIAAYRALGKIGEIGIILNLTPSYARDENNPSDVKAAQFADGFFNRSFLDPSVLGEYPADLIDDLRSADVLPSYLVEDLEIIKNNTVDLLGINYYQPRRIQARENPHEWSVPMPEDFFETYDMPNKKINPYRGWEIYEKGIYDTLTNIREDYGNIPCYISENGMGVEDESRFIDKQGQINDDYRIEFVSEHLKYVHQAITEGSNVRGYHMWTFIDNWSWLNAYKNRYGFVSLDLENDGKRTIKKSGHWYKKVSENNGFED